MSQLGPASAPQHMFALVSCYHAVLFLPLLLKLFLFDATEEYILLKSSIIIEHTQFYSTPRHRIVKKVFSFHFSHILSVQAVQRKKPPRNQKRIRDIKTWNPLITELIAQGKQKKNKSFGLRNIEARTFVKQEITS